MDFYLTLLWSAKTWQVDKLLLVKQYICGIDVLYMDARVCVCVRLTLENGSTLSGSPAAAALEAAAASCSAPSVKECDTCWPP